MEIIKYISVFAAAFITLLILDTIWLGTVTKDFIIREFGSLIAIEN